MKRISMVLVLVLIAMVTFTAIPIEVFAEEWVAENGIFEILGTSGASMHSRTKLNQDSNDTPTVTIFTHGMDSKAYFWGGTAGLVGENPMWVNQFDMESFPMQLLELYNTMYSANVAELYVAFSTVQFKTCVGVEYEDTGYFTHRVEENASGMYFELRRVDSHGIVRETKNISTIDFNKNIIIVYQDSINEKEEIDNQEVNVGIELALRYDEFHYIVDSICDAALTDTGIVPRLNLIGHSRGGLLNMIYAIHHKYNVDTLYSLGTPYNGSWIGEVFDFASSIVCQIETYDINDKTEIIKQKWNESNTWQYVNLKTVSSTMDLKFVVAVLQDMLTSQAQNIDIPWLRSICQVILEVLAGALVDVVFCLSPMVPIISLLLLPAFDVLYELYHDEADDIYSSLTKLTNDPNAQADAYIDEIVGAVTSLLSIESQILEYVWQNNESLVNTMGDMVVSLSSQKADGYKNNNPNANSNYLFTAEVNSLNVYKCEMDVDGHNKDILSRKSDTGMPGAPHNLQSRHPLIIEEILSSLTLANCSHEKTYTNNGNTHTKSCACGSVAEPHEYTYTQLNAMSNGLGGSVDLQVVPLPTPSKNLYFHNAYCEKCHYSTQLGHNWTEFGTGYKCGDCLLYSTNIPIARPDNRFTLQQQIAIGTLLEGQSVAISNTETVTLVGGVYFLSHSTDVGVSPAISQTE